MYSYSIDKDKQEQYYTILSELRPDSAKDIYINNMSHDIFGRYLDKSINGIDSDNYFIITSKKQLEDLIAIKEETDENYYYSPINQIFNQVYKNNKKLIDRILQDELIYCTFQIKGNVNNTKGITDISTLIELDNLQVKYESDKKEKKKENKEQEELEIYNEDKDLGVDKDLGIEEDNEEISRTKLIATYKLNTSNNTIQKIIDMKKEIESYREQPNKITQNESILATIKKYESIFTTFGNINEFNLTKEQEEIILEPFKITKNKSTYYVFTGQKGAFIYKTDYNSINAKLIYTEKDAKEVLGLLGNNQHVNITKKKIREELNKIELDAIKRSFQRTNDLSYFSKEERELIRAAKTGKPIDTMQQLKFVKNRLDFVLAKDSNWKLMNRILYNNKELRFMPLSLQLLFVEKKTNSHLTNKLLEEFEKIDNSRLLEIKPNEFIKKINYLGNDEKNALKYITKQKISSGKQIDERVLKAITRGYYYGF